MSSVADHQIELSIACMRGRFFHTKMLQIQNIKLKSRAIFSQTRVRFILVCGHHSSRSTLLEMVNLNALSDTLLHMALSK